MKEKYIQILGLALTFIYGVFVVFLYAAEPRSIEEISSKAKTTVGSAVTKGQVVTGTYEIDRQKFNDGLQAFRNDNFIGARDSLERADPEKRDANTQYYVAYSYYRQGWGRLSNDDALFSAGLEAVNRVIAIDPNFRSSDESLGIKAPAELKNELEEGLKITPSDFNPMRLTRERK